MTVVGPQRVLSSLAKSLTRESSIGRGLQANPFSAWRQRSHPAPAQQESNLSLHRSPLKSASILGMCLQLWRCMWLSPAECCSWPGVYARTCPLSRDSLYTSKSAVASSPASSSSSPSHPNLFSPLLFVLASLEGWSGNWRWPLASWLASLGLFRLQLLGVSSHTTMLIQWLTLGLPPLYVSPKDRTPLGSLCLEWARNSPEKSFYI